MPSVTIPEPCADDEAIAEYNAMVDYDAYKEKMKNEFRAQYIEHCLNAYQTEVFTMEYKVQEYHYTLYFYDQAGNLTQTVPPAGVTVVTSSGTLTGIQSARINNTTGTYPTVGMPSKYRFNSLNQLQRQETPDAGVSDFWYDCLGRLVISRNAKQNAPATNKLYSYTLYDELNRIEEVGQLTQTTSMTVSTAFDAGNLATWLAAGTSKVEITKTFYDVVQYSGIQSKFGPDGQTFLRGRVVSTTYTPSGSTYTQAVHYSYDLHGNVNILIRENTALSSFNHDFKRVDYSYDLVSGKVNQVAYQADRQDQYYHKYEYDADNRITDVYTSTDARTWDKDATYKYYKHGPLMRTVLGQLRVQGLDYAYTIHGWLKGVNSATLQTNRDIGKDGDQTVVTNRYTAKDVMGFTLGYYEDDYLAINLSAGTNHFDATLTSSQLNTAAEELFNGNIRMMTTAIAPFMAGSAPPLAAAYSYDQLNRLAQAEYYTNIDQTDNEWLSSGGASSNYKNNFTYDANGNILTQVRKGEGATLQLDDLTYHYQSGTNKLTYVDDAISSGIHGDDIDDQSSGNYTYDEIGNMISDAAEEIDAIEWTVYGKIKSITRTSGSTKSDLLFEYSPDGHRISKLVKPRTGSGLVASDKWTYTYYTRDAQGNTMATYEVRDDSIWLEELEMYGSSRLGMIVTRKLLAHNNNAVTLTNYTAVMRGQKRYELSNHLGNVLVVLSDKVTPVCSTGVPTTAYDPEIIAAYDYSPFGAMLQNRTTTQPFCYINVEQQPNTLSTENFSSGIGSWTATGSGTVTHDNVNNEMDVSGPIAPFGAASGTYSTTIGEEYTLTFDLGIGNCTTFPQSVHVKVFGSNPLPLATGVYTTSGTFILTFTADATSITITASVPIGPIVPPLPSMVGCGFSLDNIVITYETPINVTYCNDQYNSYRFGFNGMEKDNAVKGEGNSYDFGARIYDSRLGRWMSTDPLWKLYPGRTVYSFANNTPIYYMDIDGEVIKGTNAASAKLLQSDIQAPFTKYESVQKLFTIQQDGMSIQSISKDDYAKAMVTLKDDPDAKGLFQGYYDAISSSKTHAVAFIGKDEKVDLNNEMIKPFEASITANSALNEKDVRSIHMGGITFSDNTSGNSISIITIDPTKKLVTTDVGAIADGKPIEFGKNAGYYDESANRPSTTAHELLGHASNPSKDPKVQDVESIQVSNMVYRIQNVTHDGKVIQRTGQDHQPNRGYSKPVSKDVIKIPSRMSNESSTPKK